jgi:hypothetical protein
MNEQISVTKPGCCNLTEAAATPLAFPWKQRNFSGSDKLFN